MDNEQVSIFDYSNHTMQVLQGIKRQIEWNKDHATTNLAQYTYECCLLVIDKAIEEEKK